MKKLKSYLRSLGWNFKDFKWCLENDYQVYIKPLTEKSKGPDGEDVYTTTGEYKIAVRKNGITTQGKDKLMVNGRIISSKESLSDLTFKSEAEAQQYMYHTYKYLRKKYG